MFLTATRDSIRDLERKTRDFLAWQSIVRPAVQTLNLSDDRHALAARNLSAARDAMYAALKNAYVRILAPEQPNGGVAEFHLADHRIPPSGSGEIIENAFAVLKREELLLSAITPHALLNGVNGGIWQAQDYHIGISDLWDRLANYVHAPFRLASIEVLTDAITQGVQQSLFGYAPRPEDASGNLYPDLVLGKLTPVSESGVIIRQEMARMVLDEPVPVPPVPPVPVPPVPPVPPIPSDPEPKLPTQITAAKTLDAANHPGDLAMISSEIVRTLFAAGEGVEITIQITANNPEGFPEQTTRPAKGNSEHLGLNYKER